MEQKALMRLLRVYLKPYMWNVAEIIAEFGSIDISQMNRTQSVSQKTTEKGMREFDVKASKELPDSFEVFCRVYDNAGEMTTKRIEVNVELDLMSSPVRFSLTATPDSIVSATNVAMAEVADMLKQNLREDLRSRVFFGSSDTSWTGRLAGDKKYR